MTETRGRNERLADAMARAGLSSVELATAVQVDPRTIDRWVADRSRLPRAQSRHAIAEAVQVPVGVLWPAAANGAHVTDELVAVYPSRAAMPPGLVMSLLSDATKQVDVLTLAGIWLWDAVAGFGQMLASKAAAGVDVRVCLGNPDGESVRTRGGEEHIGDLLGARCRLAATYAQNALREAPSAIRLHDTTLYASILRFDEDVLVNWHLYGAPAAESPVMQLHRTSSHGLAETVASSFDRVWSSASPLRP
jgi:transcriptional regulator with XRE-family HTH domain